MTQPHETVVPLPKPTDVDIYQAHTILGSGGNSNIRHVLTCFETKIWTMQENDEWDRKLFEKFRDSKNILIQTAICHQIDTEPDGRFKLKENVPFLNPCKKCYGAGELYRFIRKSIQVKCMKCDGKGLNPDKTYCPVCRADKTRGDHPGLIRTFGIVSQFRQITPCSACSGMGYFEPEQKDNPVVDIDTAKKLRDKLVEKPVEASEVQDVGSAIQVAPAPEESKEEMIEIK